MSNHTKQQQLQAKELSWVNSTHTSKPFKPIQPSVRPSIHLTDHTTNWQSKWTASTGATLLGNLIYAQEYTRSDLCHFFISLFFYFFEFFYFFVCFCFCIFCLQLRVLAVKYQRCAIKSPLTVLCCAHYARLCAENVRKKV